MSADIPNDQIGNTDIYRVKLQRGYCVDRSIITRSLKPRSALAADVEADTIAFGETTVPSYLAYFDPTLL